MECKKLFDRLFSTFKVNPRRNFIPNVDIMRTYNLCIDGTYAANVGSNGVIPVI